MRLSYGVMITGGGGGPVAAFQLGLTGLADGAARPGAHGSLGYTIDPDHGTETILWGVAPGDGSYGTGAQPTDYSAGDGGALWLTCSDGGQTVYLSAPIRHAAGTAPAIADGQSWTVDDTLVAIDAGASGADLIWTHSATGLSTGIGIDSVTGAITGTPGDAASGTAVITATDQYGRTVQASFAWSAELRPVALAGNGLGPFSFTVDDDPLSIDFVPDFTANGNTLSYSVTGMPSGGVDDGDGTVSGTAITAGQSGSIICTATDEYGRETISTAAFGTLFRAPAMAGNGLPDRDWSVGEVVNLDLTGDFTANGNTLGYIVTGLPQGLGDDGDGTISGAPATDGQSGTITVIATDEYGRQTASAFGYTTTAQSPAPSIAIPAAVTLVSQSALQIVATLPADPATTNAVIDDRVLCLIPLAVYTGNEQNPAAWTTGGAQYVALQAAGATVSFNGSYSGDHVVVWEARDTTTTPRTDSGWSSGTPVSVSAGGGDTTAPTASGLSVGVQDASGNLSVTVTELDEDSTVFWVLAPNGQSAPSAAQVIAGQTASGAAPTDSGSFAATTNGGPYDQALPAGLDTVVDLHVVFGDAAGNTSGVLSDTGIAIDTTAPVLERVAAVDPGASGTGWQAWTNEDGGTIHVRARAPGDPQWTASEIVAGADDTQTPAEAGPAFDITVDSANGSDANDGSAAAPYRTLGKARTGALAIGNGVRIGLVAGSSWGESLDLSALSDVDVRGVGDLQGAGLPVIDGADVVAGTWLSSADRVDTNTNVHSMVMSGFENSAVNYVLAWEDGTRFKAVTSLAACQAEAGSAFYEITSPENDAGLPVGATAYTLHIHPSGSTDPNADGKTYEATTRLYGVKTGDGATVKAVHARRVGENIGGIDCGLDARIENCIGEECLRHVIGCESGEIRRSYAYIQRDDSRTDYTGFVGYRNDVAGLGATILFDGCGADIGTSTKATNTAFYAHTSNGSSYGAITIRDCASRNMRVLAANTDVLVIERNRVLNGEIVGDHAAVNTIRDNWLTFDEVDFVAGNLGAITALGQTGGGAGTAQVEGNRIHVNGRLPTSAYQVFDRGSGTGEITLARNAVHFTSAVDNVAGNSRIWHMEAAGLWSVTGNIFDIDNGAGGKARFMTSTVGTGFTLSGANNVYHSGGKSFGPLGSNATTYLAAVQPGGEAGSVTTDPQFADPANGDFTAQATGLPTGSGLERPALTYTSLPAGLAAAEAWILETT